MKSIAQCPNCSETLEAPATNALSIRCTVCGCIVKLQPAGSELGDDVRDEYKLIDYLWVPLLSGIVVLVCALLSPTQLLMAANDNGIDIAFLMAILFIGGVVGSLPLMLYDSIQIPWLRKLTLILGVLIIVSAIVALTLHFFE